MQAMATVRHLLLPARGRRFCSGASRWNPSMTSLRLHRLQARALRRDDEGPSADEPPESLFMKELKRRGISPGSASTETATKEEEPKQKNSAQSNSSREWISNEGQLKRSRALNSEGLDGLIPRAIELIKLGTTFCLAFWPLILAIFAVFIVMYWYFGSSFVHPSEGSGIASGGRPSYVDPYQLLEEEELSAVSYLLPGR